MEETPKIVDEITDNSPTTEPVKIPNRPRKQSRRLLRREAVAASKSGVTTTRLAELKAMPYPGYLQTPEWLERREQALQRAEYRCQVCYTADNLNVHHRTYERRGNERPGDLTVLCKPCHEHFHQRLQPIDVESQQRVVPIAIASDRFTSNLIELHNRPQKDFITGVPTGFTLLDYALGGLQPSDLITLAARTAVGKSSFALSVAHHLIGVSLKEGKRTLIFSLEMSEIQLMRRLYSMETGIDQMRLRMGNINDSEWKRVEEAQKRFLQGKMWIDDTPGISLQDMRNRARQIQSQHGLDLLIVDYLQLMRAVNQNGKTPENRVQEVSLLSRGLKELARDLNVPVLALAQLSRAAEARPDKVPQLSDLRESGSIETDSDIVLLIHRDPDIPADKNGYNLDIMIAKHRNGPVGTIPLRFIPHLTKFYDVEPEQYQGEGEE